MKTLILTIALTILSVSIIETSNSNIDMDSLIDIARHEAAIQLEYNSMINRAIEKYNIDIELATYIYDITHGLDVDYYIFLELIYVESRFVSNAVSITGAVGYTQLKPISVKEVLRLHNVSLNRHDPYENILIGVLFFSSLITDYGFGIREALIFYNIGSRKDLQASGQRYAENILARSL